MPLFNGRHFSNPKVGERHGGASGDTGKMAGTNELGGAPGEMPEPQSEGQGPAKSYHVFHHEDGSAHSHIHHEDGTHEHTDHATHQEAHDHVAKAVGEDEQMEGEQPASEEEGEAPQKHMSMHSAARMGGGAF